MREGEGREGEREGEREGGRERERERERVEYLDSLGGLALTRLPSGSV